MMTTRFWIGLFAVGVWTTAGQAQSTAARPAAPPAVTLGFEETFYLTDADGRVTDVKRHAKTKYFERDKSASVWRRGDVVFRIVADGGRRVQTVAASGEGFQARKSTFARTESTERGSDESKARLRAELCGLQGAATKRILGFDAYRSPMPPIESENGAVVGEQWIAPALTCVPLETRIWKVFADGTEVTIKSLQPLFRRDGVPAGAFDVPAEARESRPSELESAVREQALGTGFRRLDERHAAENALLED